MKKIILVLSFISALLSASETSYQEQHDKLSQEHLKKARLQLSVCIATSRQRLQFIGKEYTDFINSLSGERKSNLENFILIDLIEQCYSYLELKDSVYEVYKTIENQQYDPEVHPTMFETTNMADYQDPFNSYELDEQMKNILHYVQQHDKKKQRDVDEKKKQIEEAKLKAQERREKELEIERKLRQEDQISLQKKEERKKKRNSKKQNNQQNIKQKQDL